MKKETFEKAKSIQNKIEIIETQLSVGVSWLPSNKEEGDFSEAKDRIFKLASKAVERIKKSEISRLQKEFDNLK